MGGFEALPQATSLGEAYAPILPDETRFVDESEWDDATALGIVLADIDAGIAYEQAKNLITNMEMTDDFIRGYVRIRPWPNSDKPRSALSMPVVLEAIEKTLRKMHLALWGSGKDPFDVTAVGKTSPDTARAWQSLLRWGVRVSDLKEQSRLAMKGILSYGFGGMTDGWASRERIKRNEKYRKNTAGEIERNPDAGKEVIAEPTAEAFNSRNTIFDPSCPSQDPRKGKWFSIHRTVNAYDLDDMREDPTYDEEYDEDYQDEETGEKLTRKAKRSKIPSRDELRVILANRQAIGENSMMATQPNQTREFQKQDDKLPMSKDPLMQPLELIEYNTATRVVTVFQRCIVFRNEKKKVDKLGVYGCSFIDVLNSMFGWGVGRLLGGEQRLQQGVLNTWVDSLALLLNPAFQQIKGMGAGSQNISIGPGKVVTVEGELKPLVVPDVSETAQNAISASEQRTARRIGAEGGTNMPTQAMRTGSGVQSFQGADTEASQYFLETFTDLVLTPILQSQLEHICEYLTPAQIQQILSDEDGKAYGGDVLDIYNADVKIEITTGAKLAARAAASQMMPLIIQIVANQAVQQSLQISGKKFRFDTLFEESLELAGLDEWNLIDDMNADDMQRMQMQNQAAVTNQGKLTQIAAQHKADLDSIDAKAATQAGIAVVKGNIKQHLDANAPKNAPQ